jgi:hypothetical protein
MINSNPNPFNINSPNKSQTLYPYPFKNNYDVVILFTKQLKLVYLFSLEPIYFNFWAQKNPS